MTIINTDTNAIVGGLPVPAGSFEFPFEGDIGVLTSLGTTNFVAVGSGDTLMVWPGGAAIVAGPQVWMWFLAGLGVSFLLLGLVVVRRGVRVMVHGPSRADL